jgi:hypothetical protein
MRSRRSAPRRRGRESELLLNLRTARFLARRLWRVALYGTAWQVARRLHIRA